MVAKRGRPSKKVEEEKPKLEETPQTEEPIEEVQAEEVEAEVVEEPKRKINALIWIWLWFNVTKGYMAKPFLLDLSFLSSSLGMLVL